MRIKSGVVGFDFLVEGGIPEGACLVLQGPTGNEKDQFALQFAAEGLRNGEGVIFVVSSESPEKLKEKLEILGVQVEKCQKEGSLRIVDWYSHKEEMVADVEEKGAVIKCSIDIANVAIALSRAIASIASAPRKRAVFEILSPALSVYDLQEVYSFARGTRAKLEKNRITSIFLIEKEMHDPKTLSTLHQPFDGVIDIERGREGDRLVRKIAVLSMMDTVTELEYVPFNMGKDNLIEVLSLGRKEGILRRQDKLLKANPKDEKLWLGMGYNLMKMGQIEKALKCFDFALRLNPHYGKAWKLKGDALTILGREEEAKACYAKASYRETKQKKNPSEKKEEKVRERLAEEKRISCPRCSLEMSFEETVCQGCGATLPKEEVRGVRIVEILRLCKEKLKVDPKDADAWFVKSACLARTENYEEAIRALDELSRIDPSYPGLWIFKAKIYAKLGNANEARLCRQKALEIEGKGRGIFPKKEQFQCPQCSAMVDRDAKKCHSCGVKFVEEEKAGGGLESIRKEEELVEEKEFEVRKEVQEKRREILSPEKKPIPSRRKGLTNGLSIRASRREAGKTNGLVNGLRGRTNGLVNGLRGKTNGLVNGLRGKVNG